MRTLLMVILGLVTALFVACGSDDDSTPTATPTPVDPNALADPQDALDAARDLWAQQGGDDYDMTFNWQCFCIVDFVQRADLEVRGDSVEGGVVTDSGDPVSSDMLAEYQTVSELFDLIQDAIDQDAAEIRVTYAAAGYPDEVWIDYDERIADEERGFFIHALSLS
jgi:Family of unknown function (DUF6174)